MLTIAAALLLASTAIAADTPSQVHTVITGVSGELAVEWATAPASSCGSTVMYGPSASNMTMSVEGKATPFELYGVQHVALLQNLEVDSMLYYKVGDTSCGWSKTFSQHFEPSGPITFAVFGDAGAKNFRSQPQLVADAEAGVFQYVLHVGDAAYNLDSGNGTTGDEFMNLMQDYATVTPTMFTPGNHEAASNFSQLARFSSNSFLGVSSGSNTVLYSSFDIGQAHIVYFDSEIWTYSRSEGQITRMLNWLRADLSAVNRSKTPWVILGGHKSFYMSPSTNWTAMEPLVREFNVDIALAGHVHNYERYAPLLSDDNKPVAIDFSCLSNNNETYTSAKYPIYVIAGSAGCRENIKPGCGAGGPETLACDDSYGYLQMTVYNGTHISARWLETSAEVEDPATRFHDQAPATVKDQFWIIKE